MVDKLLFLPVHEPTLKEMLPLASGLQATGRYQCVFVIFWQCAPEWLEACNRQGIPYRLVGEAAESRQEDKQSFSKEIINAPRKKGHIHFLQKGLLRLLPEPARRFAIASSHYRNITKLAEEILQKERPALVIVSGDRLIGLETALISKARQSGIPSLIVPASLSASEGSARFRLKQPDFARTYGMESLVNRIIARSFPNWSYTYENQKMLFLPAEDLLAAQVMKIMPDNPWSLGGGHANRMAVESQAAYRLLQAGGTKPSKMVITGKASADTTFHEIQDAQNKRIEICNQIGLNPEIPILLCSVPQLGEHNLLPWPEHWQEIGFLLETFASLDQVQIVLSLHPKSRYEDYCEIASRFNAKIARHYRIEQLMPICEIFVATFSSTVTLAIGCKKPAVVVDFYNFNYDLYDNYPGILVLREKGQLLPTLKRILNDRPFYQQLADGQAVSASDSIVLDGKCTQRLIDLVDQMVKISSINTS